MTNKTITLPREVGEMILRNRDRLGSGIIDPVRAALADPVPPACCKCGKPTACGKMICEECCYEPLPVPPADEEPEVLQAVEDAMWGCFRDGVKEYRGCTRERVEETRSLIRAHVTRLQAEVKRLDLEVSAYDYAHNALSRERDALKAELRKTNLTNQDFVSQIGDLQSELTKARELLEIGHISNTPGWREAVATYLSNQSAPADKGQDHE